MKSFAFVAAAVTATLLAACSSPPVIRLHSLLAAPGESQAPEATASKLAIDLGVIGVPASVDQPQWLVRLPDESLRLLEQEQWAAPLRDELHAAVWYHLHTKFGAVPPQSASGVAAWRVQIDVQRFESIVGQQAWIEASWSIASMNRDNKTTLACQTSIREAATGDVSALAAAHRRATAKLADEIGTAAQALAKAQPASCVKR